VRLLKPICFPTMTQLLLRRYTHTHTHTHTCTYTHKQIHTYMYICSKIGMYTYVCAKIYIFTYMFICILVHADTLSDTRINAPKCAQRRAHMHQQQTSLLLSPPPPLPTLFSLKRTHRGMHGRKDLCYLAADLTMAVITMKSL